MALSMQDRWRIRAVSLSGDFDQQCAARMQAFFDHGVADAEAGKPMRRTLENLGGLYCSQEGTAYERGWYSIEHKRRKADAARPLFAQLERR